MRNSFFPGNKWPKIKILTALCMWMDIILVESWFTHCYLRLCHRRPIDAILKRTRINRFLSWLGRPFPCPSRRGIQILGRLTIARVFKDVKEPVGLLLWFFLFLLPPLLIQLRLNGIDKLLFLLLLMTHTPPMLAQPFWYTPFLIASTCQNCLLATLMSNESSRCLICAIISFFFEFRIVSLIDPCFLEGCSPEDGFIRFRRFQCTSTLVGTTLSSGMGWTLGEGLLLLSYLHKFLGDHLYLRVNLLLRVFWNPFFLLTPCEVLPYLIEFGIRKQPHSLITMGWIHLK